MRNIIAQVKTGESQTPQYPISSTVTLTPCLVSASVPFARTHSLVADLVGIVAVDLPELLHCPLGPSNKGEGIPEFLQLCNEQLTRPFLGHCIQMTKRDLKINFEAHTKIYMYIYIERRQMKSVYLGADPMS